VADFLSPAHPAPEGNPMTGAEAIRARASRYRAMRKAAADQKAIEVLAELAIEYDHYAGSLEKHEVWISSRPAKS
jgi:hypothetical protein